MCAARPDQQRDQSLAAPDLSETESSFAIESKKLTTRKAEAFAQLLR